MNDLRQVFYVSRSTPECGEREVGRILDISRRNNRRLDITGCLIGSGRHFAQVVEGRVSALAPLTERIAADSRHTDFRVLSTCAIERRGDAEWSMAYLYNLDIGDRIEALFATPEPAPHELLQVMRCLQPDSVMGAL